LAIWQKRGTQKRPEREKIKIERHISSENFLRRVLGVPSLLLYGLAIITGAGIYVLVGAVVSKEKMAAPLAFLVAGPGSGMERIGEKPP
jgi:hypothetical protein